jgi:CheY-like chemotaxis protein
LGGVLEDEGLEAIQRERPDAVVLDVAMPRMDGVNFLEALPRDAVVGGTPVVVTTAVTDQTITDRMVALGVSGTRARGIVRWTRSTGWPSPRVARARISLPRESVGTGVFFSRAGR